MARSLALAVLLVAAARMAATQTFPAPGTGAFTWERVGDRSLNVDAFAFAPDGHLYIATDSLFVFEPAKIGLPAGRWRALGHPRGFAEAALVINLDTIFVANGNGGIISRTVDGGATWSIVSGYPDTNPDDPINGPKEPDGFHVVPPGHPHAGRLLAGGVLLFSDDRGATWADAAQDLPPVQQAAANSFATLPSGRVLAATGGGVTASDDGGASYARTPLWGPVFLYAVTALATPGSAQSGAPACGLADGGLCDGAVALGFSTLLPDVRVWRTADGGRSWAPAVPLPEPTDGAGYGYTAGVVPLGAGADGLGRAVAVLGRGLVYRTVDGGQTWEPVGRLPIRLGGPSHRTRLARVGPDGHLWVSTTLNGPADEWIYRSAEPTTAAFTVSGEAGPDPASGLGLSVWPNPARDRAAVRLAVGRASRSAVVTVYDALGRRAAVLHDGPLAGGLHELAFDASALAPGLYVVVARGDREDGAAWTAARRVVLGQ